MEDKVQKLLEGSYDVHLHATPCIQKRRMSIYQLTQEAQRAGLRGFVVKDHNFSTAPHAAIINEIQQDVKVVGGITINRCVGGFNPLAVETSFKLGGKVVWMPSLESSWMFEMMNSPDFKGANNYKNIGTKATFPGLNALVPGTDELIPEVKEIMDLCRQYHGVFETSHFSKKETMAAIREAKRQGVKRFVITHSNTELTYYPIDLQKELVEQGAVMMYSLDPYAAKPTLVSEDMGQLKRMIQAVGAENIVLATDFGQVFWPPAVEGIRMLIAILVTFGIPDEDIRMMLTVNPERLYMD